MPSVFDDPREPLPPPTLDELVERAGRPTLAFDLRSAEIVIPQGLLACCRVTHQPHCEHHTAMCLFATTFEVVLPDGAVEPRGPYRQSFDGDVLARASQLAAAVQALYLTAQATAEARGGTLRGMHFDVWAFNLELTAIYRYLTEQSAEDDLSVLQRSDELDGPAIEALEISVIGEDRADDPYDPRSVAQIMAGPRFHPAAAYADRVLVLPHEIGHDDWARYVTNPVLGNPGDVPQAVESILRDPQEVR